MASEASLGSSGEGVKVGSAPKLVQPSKFPVRHGILNTYQNIIPCSSVLPASEGILRFHIPKCEGRVTNLSLMKLNLELRGGHTSPVTAGQDCGKLIPGEPISSLFKNIIIRLNNQVVSDQDSYFVWISDFLRKTKVNPTHMRACEISGDIYNDDYPTVPVKGDPKDPEKVTEVQFLPHHWKDADIRLERYKEGKKSFLSTYLFVDVNCAAEPLLVPPSVDVVVEAHFAPPSRTFLVAKPDVCKPKVDVLRAEIVLPRIIPAPGNIPKSIQLQYMRVKGYPVFIGKGVTNHSTSLTFSGSVPSRVFLRFVSGKGFDGNGIDNPYHSRPYDIQSVSFGIAGEMHPSEGFTMDWKSGDFRNLFLRNYENFRYSVDNTKAPLPKLAEFSDSKFFFVQDLSRDQATDSSWITKTGDGSLNVSLKFAEATPESIVALVIFESISILSVSSSGDVSVR